MVLVIIGPVTHDLVIIGDEESEKIGGATYFQSFVFEKFYKDYLAIVNCSDVNLVNDFPSKDKVNVILKEDTHFFINYYPNKDDMDYREQLSNFANIPIYPNDLKDVLPDEIEGFVLNPLNKYDFPIGTIEYLKSFQNDHLVVPATRSIFSYSNHFVLNPTQGKIPFVKRFLSHKETTASLYVFVISLKSLAPSTTWTSDIFLIIL